MAHNIPEYDWNFAHIEWGRGLSFYRHRLKQLRLDAREELFLDAGCGVGQWMDALSSFGKEIVGIDVRASRLEIASIFLHGKTSLVRASTEALPFRDDVFSNVICNGVIMFVDAEKASRELDRVSKSGALLYICWNAIGWSLHLLFSRRYDFRIKIQAIQTILNTWRNKRGTRYFSRRRMTCLLNDAGFKVQAMDGEGLITSGEKPRPVYDKSYLGFDNVLETLAIKSSP